MFKAIDGDLDIPQEWWRQRVHDNARHAMLACLAIRSRNCRQCPTCRGRKIEWHELKQAISSNSSVYIAEPWVEAEAVPI